jgi:MFS family permease
MSAGTEPAYLTSDRPSTRAALWLCFGAGFITLLDQSVFVLAVPSMAAGLHADSAQVQWILASYSLAFGVALVPAGRLGDILGRRRLFIAGIAVFGTFSLVGGLATEPGVVIAARLLQGLGAGTLNPQVLGLLQDLHTGAQRAKALGYYAAAGGAAAVCGPVIGGLVLSAGDAATGWRLLFLMNVPLVLILVPLAVRFLPKRPGRIPGAGQGASGSIDVVGALLLGSVVVASLIPTVYGASGSTVLWFAAGAALLLAFVGWEWLYCRRRRTPLFSPAIARPKAFVLGTVVALCQFGVGAGMAAMTAFYFLSGTGLAPLVAAGILVPQAVGMLVASGFSWRFVGRFGRAGIVFALVAALATLLAKDLAVQQFGDEAAAAAVALMGLVQGVAMGLAVAPNQTLTLGYAPAGAAGVAAGFYRLSQRFSAALCSAGVAGLFLRAATSPGGDDYRGAFHDGILMCSVLLGVAVVAGVLDWIRIELERRREQAAAGAASLAAPAAEADQRADTAESVDV